MPKIIALIPVDLTRSRLGLPAQVGKTLGGQTVLAHTVQRLLRVPAVRAAVLVHPAEQNPLPLLNHQKPAKPLHAFGSAAGLFDPAWPYRAAARKWALSAWRGGLGGLTCYDELLPPGPLANACEKFAADAALLVGGDWPLVDPDWCQKIIDLYLEQGDATQMTFTQAPPGLAGVVLNRKLLRQLADNHATLGQALAYNPQRPQADPIGRDVCVQIPGAIRSCAHRFIADTPRSLVLLEKLAAQLGPRFAEADALTIAHTVSAWPPAVLRQLAPLPQQVTLELTSRRLVNGPIIPQHHVKIERPDLPVALAEHLIAQLAQVPDTVVLLGGLGDALLHPNWERIVAAAHQAGVFGIGLETDLLCTEAAIDRLVTLPIDVISVRLNADTAKLYAQVNGSDGFGKALANLQRLFNQRTQRQQSTLGPDGNTRHVLPWIVPRLVKTADTLPEMENFFDKWTYFVGQAVIDPATTGCGLMPGLSPVDMAPPKRLACRQLARRMTIHSDGRVALCDQDWLSRACAGDAKTTPLVDIWRSLNAVAARHDAGEWDALPLCGACSEWHRP